MAHLLHGGVVFNAQLLAQRIHALIRQIAAERGHGLHFFFGIAVAQLPGGVGGFLLFLLAAAAHLVREALFHAFRRGWIACGFFLRFLPGGRRPRSVSGLGWRGLLEQRGAGRVVLMALRDNLHGLRVIRLRGLLALRQAGLHVGLHFVGHGGFQIGLRDFHVPLQMRQRSAAAMRGGAHVL